jgi:glycosyltransferase involved in cell wall biosynthesis
LPPPSKSSARPGSILTSGTDTELVRPRVALFQAFWKLHSGTLFAALTLARAGYDVDIFLFNVDEVIPTSFLEGITGVSVHCLDLTQGDRVPARTSAADHHSHHSGRLLVARYGERILRNARRNVGRIFTLLRFWLRSDKGLIPERVLKRTIAILRPYHYKAFIGVDKGGLAWAGAIANRLSAPLIYSSLELYTRDHWFYSGCYTQKRLKLAEEKYHRRCWATIVQDELRGKVLIADNRVQSEMRMFYVPICRLGEPEARTSHWLQDHLALPRGQVIILSHGLISPMRFSVQIAELAQIFPNDWTLVIHGYGENSILREIRELDARNKVVISLNLVDLLEEQMIVGSATVSLVFYGDKYLNDKLTGFSSEKLALSLQCGVPVVAFDYPSYGHIREERCGVLIGNISEIPMAISQILADYSGYRSRAFSTFKKYYQFEANFKKVLNALDELP